MTDQFDQAIETQFGIFRDRDTFFVYDISLSLYPRELRLSGIINGTNASRNPTGQDLTYTCIFHQVMALKMIELDSWDWQCKSCFDEIVHSTWIAALKEKKGKVSSEHKHYRLQTYDEVFEVVCRSYSLEVSIAKSTST